MINNEKLSLQKEDLPIVEKIIKELKFYSWKYNSSSLITI